VPEGKGVVRRQGGFDDRQRHVLYSEFGRSAQLLKKAIGRSIDCPRVKFAEHARRATRSDIMEKVVQGCERVCVRLGVCSSDAVGMRFGADSVKRQAVRRDSLASIVMARSLE
jgi:hypothetical protein